MSWNINAGEVPGLNARIKAIPLPARMGRLAISAEGYPVPWFVKWVDRKPDFRVIDTPKIITAIHSKLCWLCGGKLGTYQAFVVGPMCVANRISSEPPSHRECAEYAIHACPFLTQPKMRRNEVREFGAAHVSPAGMLKHNPGVTVLWMTKSYRAVRADDGRTILFQLGEPTEVRWFCEGRPAARAEAMAGMEKGLPELRRIAAREGRESEALMQRGIDAAGALLPEE